MENMILLQSQPTPEGSTPLTEDEIYKRVLGTRLGYVRGLGHGVVGHPSSSSGIYNYQRVEDLTKMVTVAERQAQELVERLQQMEARRQQMETRRQQMEAQMDDIIISQIVCYLVLLFYVYIIFM